MPNNSFQKYGKHTTGNMPLSGGPPPCVSSGNAFLLLRVLNMILRGGQAPCHSPSSKQEDSPVLDHLRWGAPSSCPS